MTIGDLKLKIKGKEGRKGEDLKIYKAAKKLQNKDTIRQ